MFFRRLAEWIIRRPVGSLLILLLLAHVADTVTAYLSYQFNPFFFLGYEQNPLAIAAFHYGRWEFFFLNWADIIFAILGFIVVLKYYLKKEIFLNFFLTALIVMIFGATSSNVCGIALKSPEVAQITHILFLFLAICFIITGLRWQYSAHHKTRK